MNMMLDASCAKCRRRFGWRDDGSGKAVCCPRCGAAFNRSGIDSAIADMTALLQQAPIRDAIVAAISVVGPGHRTTALKQLAHEQGWDWPALKDFFIGSRALPADLVAKVQAWAGVRS